MRVMIALPDAGCERRSGFGIFTPARLCSNNSGGLPWWCDASGDTTRR